VTRRRTYSKVPVQSSKSLFGFQSGERKVGTRRKWHRLHELTVIHLLVDILEELSTVLHVLCSHRPLVDFGVAWQSLRLDHLEPTFSKPKLNSQLHRTTQVVCIVACVSLGSSNVVHRRTWLHRKTDGRGAMGPSKLIVQAKLGRNSKSRLEMTNGPLFLVLGTVCPVKNAVTLADRKLITGQIDCVGWSSLRNSWVRTSKYRVRWHGGVETLDKD